MPTTSHTRKETSPARRRGLAAALSLVPAVVPLGAAMGVALSGLSSHVLLTWLGAPLLVAGASHVVLVGQLDAGASVLAAASAVVVVNSRFLVYGAALAARFRSQPVWFRWLAPHWIVDQTYGMVLSRFGADEPDDDFRHFFAAASALLWLTWSASVGVGMLLGPVVPASVPLEFVLPAMFVALVVPGLRSAGQTTTALAAVCVGFAIPGPTAPLMVAALVGALVGGSSWGEEPC